MNHNLNHFYDFFGCQYSRASPCARFVAVTQWQNRSTVCFYIQKGGSLQWFILNRSSERYYRLFDVNGDQIYVFVNERSIDQKIRSYLK